MKRRNFLQLAAAAGLGVAAPWSARSARAQSQGYAGPYWVQVNAAGGWDPTFLFNPVLDDLEQNRRYTSVGQIGGISYADIPVDPAALGLDETLGLEAYLMSNAAFLEKYASRLTVVNGIDTSTNNHDAGSRAMWSGQLTEGYPSIGALVASKWASDKPMAYVSAGGYDTTAGIIPLTRVASADSMKKLAAINRVDPNNAENLEQFHASSTYERVRAAQSGRLASALEKQHLPRLKASMSQLFSAREHDWEVGQIKLPEELVSIPGQLGGLQGFAQQAQLAVAAFKSGLAASANLNLGGFDTHSNHDRDQSKALAMLLFGIDFLMEEAKKAGIDGQLIVLAASDFGRGPFYNGDGDGAGKDHWPITSMFAMGPGIAGGRVIGATTEDQRARLVVPGTFEVVDGVEGANAVKLKPQHVHHALRVLAGLDDQGSGFPLPHETLPLFG
jgi:uncharacterized protein (DUF1501 family)